MVFIRFNNLVLVLILLLVKNSSAHTHQDVEKILASKNREVEAVGRSLINVNKEFSDGFPGSVEVETAKLRGRKTMSKSRLSRKEIIKECLNEEDKKTSGAAHFVANCEHDHSYRQKRTMNVKYRVGSSSSRRSDHHPMKNNKAIGFEEFTDYSPPKTHPPHYKKIGE